MPCATQHLPRRLPVHFVQTTNQQLSPPRPSIVTSTTALRAVRPAPELSAEPALSMPFAPPQGHDTGEGTTPEKRPILYPILISSGPPPTSGASVNPIFRFARLSSAPTPSAAPPKRLQQRRKALKTISTRFPVAADRNRVGEAPSSQVRSTRTCHSPRTTSYASVPCTSYVSNTSVSLSDTPFALGHSSPTMTQREPPFSLTLICPRRLGPDMNPRKEGRRAA